MSIHKETKEFMERHGTALNALSISTIGAFGALLHSEYLRNMRQKHHPTTRILVPEIDMLSDWFDDPGLDQWLSDDFIPQLLDDPIIKEAKYHANFGMFTDNVEILKTIFDLKITPPIRDLVLNRIRLQFNLNSREGTYQESPDLDIFNGCHACIGPQRHFLTHQTALQMVSVMAEAEREFPESNMNIEICDDEILIIKNSRGFAALCFDADVIESCITHETLSFVTSTEFKDISTGEYVAQKHGIRAHYAVKTSPFNEVAVVRPFSDISSNKEE